MGGAIAPVIGAIGSVAGKVGGFMSKGAGAGGEMSLGQKLAQGAFGGIGDQLGQEGQQQKQGGGFVPISVAPTPDISGFYQQRPIAPPRATMDYRWSDDPGQFDPFKRRL